MIKLKTIFITAVAVIISSQAIARDQIKIVGSSTVYPYTTVVAERFGKQGKFKTPVVESTGTGGGFKSFCAGSICVRVGSASSSILCKAVGL